MTSVSDSRSPSKAAIVKSDSISATPTEMVGSRAIDTASCGKGTAQSAGRVARACARLQIGQPAQADY